MTKSWGNTYAVVVPQGSCVTGAFDTHPLSPRGNYLEFVSKLTAQRSKKYVFYNFSTPEYLFFQWPPDKIYKRAIYKLKETHESKDLKHVYIQ